jgi:hypothetical protein
LADRYSIVKVQKPGFDVVERSPPGYTGLELIQKGSKAYVWKAVGSEGVVAIKQFVKVDDQYDKSVENEL